MKNPSSPALAELEALHRLASARVQATGDEWAAINKTFATIRQALTPAPEAEAEPEAQP
jgi:hypothetical protein